MGATPSVACVAVVLVAALIAAVTDVWKFKIHNLITLPLLLSGLGFHLWVGGLVGEPGPPKVMGLSESMQGMLCGFGVLFVFYLLGGQGAGDVKLMAAIGAWLGVPFTFYVFLASAVVQGIYALVLVVFYRNLSETWGRLRVELYRVATISRHLGADDGIEAEANHVDRKRLIPFAAMVACGIIAVLIMSWIGGTVTATP